jgi:hypothetical protein
MADKRGRVEVSEVQGVEMSAPLQVQIGSTLIVTDGDLVTCCFPDGSLTRAYPRDTPEYREIARNLGFGEDTARMNRTHDPAHCVLAEARGLPYPPVLWAVAHGEPVTEAHYAEETDVMALQLYSNGGPRPEGDLDWDAMRDRLMEVAGC